MIIDMLGQNSDPHYQAHHMHVDGPNVSTFSVFSKFNVLQPNGVFPCIISDIVWKTWPAMNVFVAQKSGNNKCNMFPN